MSSASFTIAPLLTWLESRSPRERTLLLVTVLTVLAALCYGLLAGPLLTARHDLRRQIAAAREKLDALAIESREIITRHETDPDLKNRRHLEQLQQEIAQFDLRLATMTLGLIAPREMAGVLEELLAREAGLRLVKLENLDAVALLDPSLRPSPPAGARAEGLPNVYEHGLRMEFEGSYLGAMAYLRRLEGLPCRFFWDRLEIEVLEHPKSRIVITVHTLSLQKGWIGV